MDNFLVLRIFIHHWNIELPNADFVQLKRTCREITDICRGVEHRRIDHFDLYMWRTVPDLWQKLRKTVMEDPNPRIEYDDEFFYSDVTIWLVNKREYEFVREDDWEVEWDEDHNYLGIDLSIGVMKKSVYINFDKAKLHYNACNLTDRVKYVHRQPIETNVEFGNVVDSDTYNEFIKILIENSHRIKEFGPYHIPTSFIRPPWVALKSVIKFAFDSDHELWISDIREYLDLP